eukprot:6188692-Pleurochrysis_carterae.AAC.1
MTFAGLTCMVDAVQLAVLEQQRLHFYSYLSAIRQVGCTAQLVFNVCRVQATGGVSRCRYLHGLRR